jgi:hypothetical protein
MDIVGLGTVATFFSMLFISTFAVQAQSPPSEEACTECPASGDEAKVSLSWDVKKQRPSIEACDQKSFVGGRCHEACIHSLGSAYPKIVPSTVIG